jgi:hypothetical protein
MSLHLPSLGLFQRFIVSDHYGVGTIVLEKWRHKSYEAWYQFLALDRPIPAIWYDSWARITGLQSGKITTVPLRPDSSDFGIDPRSVSRVLMARGAGSTQQNRLVGWIEGEKASYDIIAAP